MSQLETDENVFNWGMTVHYQKEGLLILLKYMSIQFRFSESIVDYISNLANAPDPTVTESHFSKEIDLGHEFIFSNWLTKGGSSSAGTTGDFNVRHAAIEVRLVYLTQ